MNKNEMGWGGQIGPPNVFPLQIADAAIMINDCIENNYGQNGEKCRKS